MAEMFKIVARGPHKRGNKEYCISWISVKRRFSRPRHRSSGLATRRKIEIDSIESIGFPDITPELARESGFAGVIDLLKVAKHGPGQNIYLIRFHYIRPRKKRTARTR